MLHQQYKGATEEGLETCGYFPEYCNYFPSLFRNSSGDKVVCFLKKLLK